MNIEKYRTSAQQAADNYARDIKNGIIPTATDAPMGQIYIILPYKIKKIDENNPDVFNNIREGEVEILQKVFEKNRPFEYAAFTIREVVRRKSYGDGVNFDYTVYFDVVPSETEAVLAFILKEIKALNITKEDLIKFYTRERYNPLHIQRWIKLSSIVNAIREARLANMMQ